MRPLRSICLLGCGLLAACAHVRPEWNPIHNPAAPSSASLTPLPNPRIPRRIAILDNPRSLKTESVHPPGLTRQRILWDGEGLEWRMRFPARRYAYTRVALKEPLNVANYRNQLRLVFRLRPARLAPFLSIGLVDSPETGAPALSDVWLMDYASPVGNEWTTVSIPLSQFPTGTLAGEATAPPSVPEEALHRELDWTRVREFRFISTGGRIPAEEIVVRDLRIQRL